MSVPSLCLYAKLPTHVYGHYSRWGLPCWFVDYDILRGQPSAKGAKVLCLER
jgi:hypothetical protein